jgi:hypothetical protein
MGVLTGILTAIQTALDQIGVSGSTATIRFTTNFQKKAKEWGLSEKDAEDVYQHGDQVKENMLVRKYNGYEIGIYYFKDNRTSLPVISSIWKRERQ